MKTALTLAILPLTLAAGVAHADRDRHHHRDYDRDRHGGYAKVIAAQPIYETVLHTRPERRCWVETVEHRTYHDSATPAIIGGIIGGVVGNRFGEGQGKDAMTVAGALLGASLGYDAGREAVAQPVHEQRCRTEHERYERERLVGYHVTYRYHGREYTTRLPYDPGERLRVRVDVRPD